MANHKSAIKRIRQAEARRVENKYYGRTMRKALKNIRETTEKDKAMEQLPKVNSLIDRLAKKNVIHRRKASNLKSKVSKHVNSL